MFMLRETNSWLAIALACVARSGQATSEKVRLSETFCGDVQPDDRSTLGTIVTNFLNPLDGF